MLQMMIVSRPSALPMKNRTRAIPPGNTFHSSEPTSTVDDMSGIHFVHRINFRFRSKGFQRDLSRRRSRYPSVPSHVTATAAFVPLAERRWRIDHSFLYMRVRTRLSVGMVHPHEVPSMCARLGCPPPED